MEGQDDEGQEKPGGVTPSVDPRRRSCARRCINYEPKTVKPKSFTSRRNKSISSSETPSPTLTPPFSDGEDPRIPRASLWSIECVLEWISAIGFPEYQSCLALNHISGRQLIQLTANSLPRMGIRNFDHIKTILRGVEELLEVEKQPARQNISLPPREIRAMYLELKALRGETYDAMTFSKFLRENLDTKFQPDHLANLAFTLPHEQRIQVPRLRK